MNLAQNPKSVTFLTNCLDYGGREVQMVQLATQLSLKGWDIKVISMQTPVAFVDELKAVGIPLQSLGMNRGIPDPRAIWSLGKLIKKWKPQILHSHLIHATLLARITRIFFRFPILIATIGNIKQGRYFHEVAFRFTDKLCDLTTNNSQLSVERYVHDKLAPKNKIQYIPNSIDLERFFNCSNSRLKIRTDLNIDSKFVWLAIGRFEVQKDYPNLLNAFSKLSQNFTNTILLICGKGSLEHHIRELVLQLNLQSKVIFLGIRQDIPKLMNAADAYVMSSAWEGMPGVLLEASATSLPVVATNVSGNAEVVVDQKSGFLVLPKDSDALEHAMQQLMQLSDDERQKMGQNGREHIINCFGLENGVKTWEKLYYDLLQNKV